VTRTLQAKDLSPLDESTLTAEDCEWLDELQRRVRPSDHLLRLGDAAAADRGEDFIIRRDAFGKWWAGRYIGDGEHGRPSLGDTAPARRSRR